MTWKQIMIILIVIVGSILSIFLQKDRYLDIDWFDDLREPIYFARESAPASLSSVAIYANDVYSITQPLFLHGIRIIDMGDTTDHGRVKQDGRVLLAEAKEVEEQIRRLNCPSGMEVRHKKMIWMLGEYRMELNTFLKRGEFGESHELLWNKYNNLRNQIRLLYSANVG